MMSSFTYMYQVNFECLNDEEKLATITCMDDGQWDNLAKLPQCYPGQNVRSFIVDILITLLLQKF